MKIATWLAALSLVSYGAIVPVVSFAQDNDDTATEEMHDGSGMDNSMNNAADMGEHKADDQVPANEMQKANMAKKELKGQKVAKAPKADKKKAAKKNNSKKVNKAD